MKKLPFDELKSEVLDHLLARKTWTPAHRIAFVLYTSRADVEAALSSLQREGLAESDGSMWRPSSGKPYQPVGHGPEHSMGDALALGQSAADKGRFMVDGAAEQYSRGFLGVRPVQTRIDTVMTPEPEFCVDPALIGGPV